MNTVTEDMTGGDDDLIGVGHWQGKLLAPPDREIIPALVLGVYDFDSSIENHTFLRRKKIQGRFDRMDIQSVFFGGKGRLGGLVG